MSAPTPTAPGVPRGDARRDWEKDVDIGREAVREAAHLIDLCVDYVDRDGTVDMCDAASRLVTASTLPVMLDSTEPPFIVAGAASLLPTSTTRC